MEESRNDLISETNEFTNQQEYWRQKLVDCNSSVLFPPTFKSGDELGCNYQTAFNFNQDISLRLFKLSKESDLSLYILLVTCLKVLIYRYTGHNDILTVSPVYRENGLGQATNSFVLLRDQVEGADTFRSLLLKVRDTTLEAYENQDVPSEKLAHDFLGSKNFFELSNIVCLLTNIHGTRSVPRVKGNIEFGFERQNNRISGWIEANSLTVEKRVLELIPAHLENIIGDILQNIDISLKEIRLLSSEERDRLLYSLNNTSVNYPAHETVTRLFESQAQKTPDQTAIEYEDTRITYRELNQKANQLARLLREKGIRPNDIIGIMMGHSPEVVAGILAIMKAGGAYLPIDPIYSQSRVLTMLNDSRAAMLLTTKELADRFSFGPLQDIEGEMAEPLGAPERPRINNLNRRPEIIFMDHLFDQFGALADHNLEGISQPDDLAYVIYTSGTTGKPKGAMITQRGLTNYIWWANRVYLKGEELSFPFYSSIAFDLTVTSLFTPLISGNKIVIYPESDQSIIIRKIIEDNKVGIVKLTPTHLKLIEDMDFSNSTLKKFIVGGEDLKTALALKISQKFKNGVEIFNEYGPTETTVGCMIHKFDPGKDLGSSVPIGIPADNVRIYILDPFLNPLPEGCVGEIYISGDGVAGGYLNRPELTAEKFVERAFRESPPQEGPPPVEGQPQRIYRTGDHARISGGIIEFIGRIDRQVKLRGYRIELEEIEAQLLKHPAIKEAAVTVRTDQNGNQFLGAYIVTQKDLTAGELKEYLLREIPHYMVPSHFISLSKLPLTSNGKIDRTKLPDPEQALGSRAQFQAPENALQKNLALLWQKILHIPEIGIDDNFFDLGGDSMLLIQMHAELEKQYGALISIPDLFLYPTIRKLAAYIQGCKSRANDPGKDEKQAEPDDLQEILSLIEQYENGTISVNDAVETIHHK